jgi:transposase
MAASSDTILRASRAAALPAKPTPRVLGVDDFSFRRGKRFGTILIDLERHCRIDLLPDRTAATLAQWLTEHPGVEVISRDRGGGYAEGARAGAPDAIQVADRFHVVANLREALERLLVRNHRVLKQVAATLVEEAAADDGPPADEGQPQAAGADPLEASASDPPRLSRPQREAAAARSRRLARYEEVRALQARGLSVRAIARQLGWSRQTVTRFAHADTFPERQPRSGRSSLADRHEAYLRGRWDDGCQNAAQLWRELQEQGFSGSRTVVSRWLVRWRIGPTRPGPPARDRPTPPPAPPTPRTYSPRHASWLLVHRPHELECEDRTYLEQLCHLSAEGATAHALAQEFGRLVRERDHPALVPWLERAEQSALPEMMGFAAGIRRDHAAVAQMLLSPWSNGQVEGQVNRLKLLKRQMYGRANFDLLRKRVLYSA